MNRIRAAALAAIVMSGWATQVLAQEAVGEVVVTAERRSNIGRVQAAIDQQAPHVVLAHRADNLITTVRVVCDTRDPTRRLNELKATLRNMIHGQNAQIELGVGQGIISRFDETMLDKVIAPDNSAADTSEATVVIKTHITAADTFDIATARITGYIERTQKEGRTEILREQDWNLTLINPEQYRGAIIARVAADAHEAANAFGPGYGARVDGLQQKVDWRQSGPLDLALFIPYQLVVEPAAKSAG
jgi:hypothetical protein